MLGLFMMMDSVGVGWVRCVCVCVFVFIPVSRSLTGVTSFTCQWLSKPTDIVALGAALPAKIPSIEASRMPHCAI